jgi:hypothetical protein
MAIEMPIVMDMDMDLDMDMDMDMAVMRKGKRSRGIRF